MSSNKRHFIKLIDLVNATRGLDWNYELLSQNRNIYLEDIEANKLNEKLEPFIKNSISQNSNITIEFVRKYTTETEKKLASMTVNEIIRIIDSGYENYYINYWDWNYLSGFFSFDIIKTNPDLPWNYKNINFKNIDWKYIFDNLNYDWNWTELTIIAPIDLIFNNYKLPWDKIHIDYNENITITTIKKYSKFNWDFDILSQFISLKSIIRNPQYEWNYTDLSLNKTLTSEYLLSNLDQKWNWEYLSENENLDFDILSESKEELPFDLDILSKNKSLTTKFILKYIDANWKWVHIHKNGIIKLEEFENNEKLINNYDSLSLNPNLDAFYIYTNRDKKWNWVYISRNPAFQVSDIEELIMKGLPIAYRFISDNPNITFDFIYKYIHKAWDSYELSLNKYNVEYNKFLTSKRIKTNYKSRKLNLTNSILNTHIIRDLTGIVNEY